MVFSLGRDIINDHSIVKTKIKKENKFFSFGKDIIGWPPIVKKNI
jgi:hypothetical protein